MLSSRTFDHQIDPLDKRIKVALGVDEDDGLGVDIQLVPCDHFQHFLGRAL